MDMLLTFGVGADSSTFELPCYATPPSSKWVFSKWVFSKQGLQRTLAIASMEGGGSYDQTDAEGFLRILGLPLRVQGGIRPRN